MLTVKHENRLFYKENYGEKEEALVKDILKQCQAQSFTLEELSRVIDCLSREMERLGRDMLICVPVGRI